MGREKLNNKVTNNTYKGIGRLTGSQATRRGVKKKQTLPTKTANKRKKHEEGRGKNKTMCRAKTKTKRKEEKGRKRGKREKKGGKGGNEYMKRQALANSGVVPKLSRRHLFTRPNIVLLSPAHSRHLTELRTPFHLGSFPSA